MIKKRKIQKLGTENYQDHRGDFETCPNCGHRMGNEEWEKIAHTLCLDPACYKAGSVSVISECPKCFSNSWVHEPMSYFGNRYPSEWKKAVIKREKEVKLAAVRFWAKAQCGRCKYLIDAHIDHHCYRSCKIGMGQATMECDSFTAE